MLVLAAALVLTACASSAQEPRTPGLTTGARAVEPPLVGTEWQLTSYRESSHAETVSVKTDSTMEYDGKGRFSAHGCNFLGGSVIVTPTTLTYGSVGSTLIGCNGERGQLDHQTMATTDGPITWSIRAGILTLTHPDGHELTYRVRTSIYPDTDARTILVGDRDGGQFRLAVDGPADGRGHLALIFETRSAPGKQWGSGAIGSPGPKDCLAEYVLGVGQLGGQTFLATWATPEVAKVTTQARSDSPETELTFFTVPGSILRIAGLWTSTFRPSISPVTFYRTDGTMIAAYPTGPC